MNFWLKLHLIIFVGLVGSISAKPKISATVDARQVLVEDSFTWKLEVEGSEEMPKIRLPDIDKVALLSGPMQSSNYSYINGKMESKKSISYTFVALEPGPVMIPAVEVYLGRKAYKTKPLKLEIVANRKNLSKSSTRDQTVFLRAIPSKTAVFVGEPLSVQYKLFTKVGVYNYQVDKLPNAVGFWAEDVPQKSQPRLVSEIIDGVRYNTAVLKTVLYYPTRSGDLVIDALKTELEVEVKTNKRSRRMFNDPFSNDPFFGGSRKANKNYYSNTVKINVKSLPEPRPDDFSGAVGRFQLRAGLDTNAVFANDAVGLSITLTGSGNFKSLKFPEPTLPDGIDIFKPERSEQVSIRGMKHSGTKKSTYLLVPREPGDVVIDPVTFTYFDLNVQKYITKSSGWIKMTVYDAEGSQPLITSGYSREEVELMQEDIRYIKAVDTQFKSAKSAMLPFKYWALHIAGILAILGVYAYEFRMQQLKGNANLRRSVKAMGLAKKKLKQAKQLSEDSPELRALLYQSIAGFIGARLNAPENALDASDLIDLLDEQDVSESTISETRELLEGLNMDRFAPGAVQRSATEWIECTGTLLQDLGKAI